MWSVSVFQLLWGGIKPVPEGEISQWKSWLDFQLQLWTNSLTSYRESKNILIQNCQNSAFQSFYFFVSIILDLLSWCRPLAMDEYLSSSLLALWKLNQWGKNFFSIFCFPFFFPFHLTSSRQFFTSPPGCCTVMNSKCISVRMNSPALHHSILIILMLVSSWTFGQRALPCRYHGYHCGAFSLLER